MWLEMALTLIFIVSVLAAGWYFIETLRYVFLAFDAIMRKKDPEKFLKEQDNYFGTSFFCLVSAIVSIFLLNFLIH